MNHLFIPDVHALQSTIHAAYTRSRLNNVEPIFVQSPRTDLALERATSMWHKALQDHERDSLSRFQEALHFVHAMKDSESNLAQRFEVMR